MQRIDDREDLKKDRFTRVFSYQRQMLGSLEEMFVVRPSTHQEWDQTGIERKSAQ